MFGGRQKREAAEVQLEQEVERLESLTSQQVAIELITKVEPFGLDPNAIPVGALAKCLAPGYGRRLQGPLVRQFLGLVDEVPRRSAAMRLRAEATAVRLCWSAMAVEDHAVPALTAEHVS